MTEDDFLRSILTRPSEAIATWLVLADWLEDHNDPRHELVRLLFDNSYRHDFNDLERDCRVRHLMLGGMKPVVPLLVNSIGMTFTLIPPGRFTMGSPLSELNRNLDEYPHLVEITRPFLMGIHPVTQGQFQQVMEVNRSHFREAKGVSSHEIDRFPVESVTWNDTQEFCEKLSRHEEEKREGRRYRLATEAEWEYACRGGARLSSPFFFGDVLGSHLANFDGNYPYGDTPKGLRLNRPSMVGSYSPNAFGLYDMHGNVWEWVEDGYGNYDESSEIQFDPKGVIESDRRVLRGGGWHVDGQSCRSARRVRSRPDETHYSYSFRVVCIQQAREKA